MAPPDRALVDEVPAASPDAIAAHIARDIRPASALHIGCGAGTLVEALRRRGVAAFGLETSQVIDNLPEPPAHRCADAPDRPFPSRYDLVICLHALDRLPDGQVEQAIANVCRHTGDILFSSVSPEAVQAEPGGARTPDRWTELFAGQGFFRDVDFSTPFLVPWAARYRRADAGMAQVVAAYERRLWLAERESDTRRELGIELDATALAREQELRAQLRAKEDLLQATRRQLEHCESRWSDLQSTPGWKVLTGLQRTRALLAPPASRREKALLKVLHVLPPR